MKRRWWKTVAMALGFLLLQGGSGVARAQAVAEAVGSAVGRGTADAAAGGLVLEVHRGRLLRLSGAASSVFVADPGIADVQVHSPGIVYLLGKRAGSTTVYAVDAEDRILLRREVRVVHAVSRLRSALREIVPEADIRVLSVDGGIVLQGSVTSPREAEDARRLASRFLGEKEELINRLVVTAPTQVSLHVRIAEVSREVTRLFGINWDTALSPGDFMIGLASGRAFNSGGPPFLRLTDENGPAGALAGRFSNGDIDINGLVDALEREGFLTVLAEPNLTALSGETAAFLAGGEFPIPVGVDNGDIEIEFKQFGVSLAFTPTVLSGNRISLRVKPEVSDLTENGAIVLQNIQIPALSTRRAETTVELASGQSFAIGGLISSSTKSSLEKFPGLGDLPVLGPLFRSTRFQREESELVIIVTPYLVRPAKQRLASPLDGMRQPSELERILQGRLVGRRPAPGRGGNAIAKAPRLVGGAGFVIE